jgi:uncharacterized protein (TIGR02246 family)
MKTLLFATSMLILAGAAQAAEPGADLKAKIVAANGAWVAAFGRGDAAGLAALYTETATMLPPGADMQKGRTAIAGFVKAVMGMGLTNVTLTTEDVARTGPDAAREIGRVTYDVPDAQKKLVKMDGKYVVNWRLVKGKWMLDTDIWNANK